MKPVAPVETWTLGSEHVMMVVMIATMVVMVMMLAMVTVMTMARMLTTTLKSVLVKPPVQMGVGSELSPVSTLKVIAPSHMS